MSDYIPYPFFHDRVAVDISFMFESERPAGKHGFLCASGRSFVFEDGTIARFWGTNFNGAGCFPEHNYAKKLAKRLAAIGINLVRMHQLDSEWHTPNIFSFTKGKRVTDATLDPESMDRLDYLIKCLVDEGIYVYMDMFTYRRFHSDEGVENAAILADAAKPYCIFSRKLIELQKKLATDLWTHYNKYTGKRYADDPAIVLAEVVNECDLFYKPESFQYEEPYKTEFLSMYSEWIEKKNLKIDISLVNISSYNDEALNKFKLELQTSYFNEMIAHLRSLGVRIPLTGTNWSTAQHTYLSNKDLDYLDAHPYYYDWRWGEFEKKCMNRSITDSKEMYLSQVAFMADKNKPTYVSEWDAPWPNEYRADSVIYSAAVGMLQGWSGFAIHTYSYSPDLERMNMLGKEISAEKIGGVPYRQGIFSAWNDPAKFGLFYHAAILTRRADVKNASTMNARIAAPNGRIKASEYDNTAVERNIIVNAVAEDKTLEVYVPKKETGDVLSETGELYRNYDKHYGFVDTPSTKCAFGFLSKIGELKLQGMTVRSETDFAVIALSSLTDSPIHSSDNLLLTTVGRAVNTEMKTDGERMLDIGKPPVLIENIEAEIEIETEVGDLKVWAISAEGYYIGQLPTRHENGKLHFSVGKESKSMYYLLVKN